MANKNYKDLVKDSLEKVNSDQINEAPDRGDDGDDANEEPMHPHLARQLSNKQHSLGDHPAFPADDDQSFEEKIMADRFRDVKNNYKQKFDVDRIDNRGVMMEAMGLVQETMQSESAHKEELEALAVKMIREEYDMSEDAVEIIAELDPNWDSYSVRSSQHFENLEDIEFDSHEEIEEANKGVYKRRFLNAMTQGAAKKSSHMFHLVDDELTDLDPRLSNRYSKVMANADYMYYIVPNMDEGGAEGGVVQVTLPTHENPIATIHARAVIFPILIHELVKGVMEILSAHGLPEEEKMAQYVINKADLFGAEPWDMRLGPALWEKFTGAIDGDDFHLKHHVYAEIAALPADEFNSTMKEILAGTAQGRRHVSEIMGDFKQRMTDEDYNDAMNTHGGEDDDTGHEPQGDEPQVDDPSGYGGYSEDEIDDIDIDDLFSGGNNNPPDPSLN